MQALHPELVDDEVIVIVRVVEVNDLDGLVLIAVAQILFDGQVIHDGIMHRLVVLHHAGGIQQHQMPDDLMQVLVVQPGIDLQQRRPQPAFKHHVPLRTPFRHGGSRR